MTAKEKSKLSREVMEYWKYNALHSPEPITITDPEEYAPLVQQLGGSITDETRRESYAAAQRDVAARRRVILEILGECGELTAREIAAELHRRGVTPSDERNFAAPRLTELKAAGQIEVTGKKICERSGRSVAVWAVKKGV